MRKIGGWEHENLIKVKYDYILLMNMMMSIFYKFTYCIIPFLCTHNYDFAYS